MKENNSLFCQGELDLRIDLFSSCKHRSCHLTFSCVPTVCNRLISQNYVYVNEPGKIGYKSADWVWHFVEGKAWDSFFE